MPDRPRGLIGYRVRRGFGKLLSPGIAGEFYKKIQTAKLKTDPPESIWDIYDMLPPSADFPEPVRPYFLRPAIDLLERACTEEVRFGLHTPPRHGKSLLLRVALLYYHFRHPGRFHVYVTYNQGKANDVKADFVYVLRELGIDHRPFDDTVLIEGGANAGGTTVKFTSVTRSLTGYTVSGVAFIDDAVANDDKAQSMVMRDKTWRWVTKDLLTRRMKFMSVVAVMTRWHQDDVLGRLQRIGFDYIRLPMVCDSADDPLGRKPGEVLWPEQNDLRKVDQIRMEQGEKGWASHYQGDPFPEGDRVFEQPKTYSQLPPGALRYYVGLDAGYGGADWSVAVLLALDPESGVCYITKVVRRRCRLDVFVPDIQLLHAAYPAAPITWIYGGTERGAADMMSSDLMKQRLPKINLVFAAGSKLYRALDVAQAWNEGRVLLPATWNGDPMMRSFVVNVTGFTGQGDPHDDDVDALAGAFEPIRSPAQARRTWQRPIQPGQQDHAAQHFLSDRRRRVHERKV